MEPAAELRSWSGLNVLAVEESIVHNYFAPVHLAFVFVSKVAELCVGTVIGRILRGLILRRPRWFLTSDSPDEQAGSTCQQNKGSFHRFTFFPAIMTVSIIFVLRMSSSG